MFQHYLDQSYTKGDPKLKWGFNMVLMVVIYEEIYKPKV